MSDEFDQEVFEVMDDLRGDNRAAVPDVGGVHRRARQQQTRRRTAAGAAMAVVMFVGGLGIFAAVNNINRDSIVSAADGAADSTVDVIESALGDEGGSVADHSSPLVVLEIGPGRPSAEIYSLGQLSPTEFAQWVARTQPKNGFLARTSDPEIAGTRLTVSSAPQDDGTVAYVLWLRAQCGPLLTYGTLTFTEQLAVVETRHLPPNMAIGDMGYACTPPQPEVLDLILSDPFDISIYGDQLFIENQHGNLSFMSSESDSFWSLDNALTTTTTSPPESTIPQPTALQRDVVPTYNATTGPPPDLVNATVSFNRERAVAGRPLIVTAEPDAAMGGWFSFERYEDGAWVNKVAALVAKEINGTAKTLPLGTEIVTVDIGFGEATVVIPADAMPGTYRICALGSTTTCGGIYVLAE